MELKSRISARYIAAAAARDTMSFHRKRQSVLYLQGELESDATLEITPDDDDVIEFPYSPPLATPDNHRIPTGRGLRGVTGFLPNPANNNNGGPTPGRFADWDRDAWIATPSHRCVPRFCTTEVRESQ